MKNFVATIFICFIATDASVFFRHIDINVLIVLFSMWKHHRFSSGNTQLIIELNIDIIELNE
jgi:hypothetical protein